MLKTPPTGELKKIFSQFPEIDAVYLFGSAATGTIHQESDLDLAVISGKNSLRNLKLEILTALAAEGYCNVDLVFPSNEDIVLLFEIVSKNNLIYKSKEFSAGTFFSRILRQYFDFYPYLTVQRKAYKKRILHGTS
jgi:hypothetical protein